MSILGQLHVYFQKHCRLDLILIKYTTRLLFCLHFRNIVNTLAWRLMVILVNRFSGHRAHCGNGHRRCSKNDVTYVCLDDRDFEFVEQNPLLLNGTAAETSYILNLPEEFFSSVIREVTGTGNFMMFYGRWVENHMHRNIFYSAIEKNSFELFNSEILCYE